jgi:hypothetical protein
MDERYLLTTVVVTNFQETNLQEVVVVVCQKVVVVDTQQTKIKDYMLQVSRDMHRAYLEYVVPFMIFYPTPYNTKSPTK